SVTTRTRSARSRSVSPRRRSPSGAAPTRRPRPALSSSWTRSPTSPRRPTPPPRRATPGRRRSCAPRPPSGRSGRTPPPRQWRTSRVRFTRIDRPVPGAEPADAVVNLVFLANLAAHETTGDTASSSSVERVQHRLRGSVEYDTLAFALEVPDEDPAGYLLVSTPLLEDRDVVEAEVILDAGHLPLPGAGFEPEGRAVLSTLFAEAEAVPPAWGAASCRPGCSTPPTRPRAPASGPTSSANAATPSASRRSR